MAVTSSRPVASAQDADRADALLDAVARARAAGTPLDLRGGGSKRRLGRRVDAAPLDLRGHRGIVAYDPTELVLTARAGTPLVEIETALAAAGQMLPCEPPRFTDAATLGGAVAAGLSGPRRPWAGAVRDFVLGVRLITGHATHLRFGGEVMKNVAGYDVSRLLAGSFGCLGVITEVSLKVLPLPRRRLSLQLAIDPDRAQRKLNEWIRQAVPITGACHDGADTLYLRLEGGTGSVDAARDRLGCEQAAPDFWESLNAHRLPFFQDPRPLWRLSLPNDTPALRLPGEVLIDWAGAQRWLKSDADAATIRAAAAGLGGHAVCFDPDATREPFHPLPPALLALHRRLKAQMDPLGLFNPGRMYAEF